MHCVSSAGKFGKTWGALAVALWLGGATSLVSAQTAPGVKLACPTPNSQAVTATLSTAANTWETSLDGGATWAPAAAFFYGPPWLQTPPATWIGGNSNALVTNVHYRVRVDSTDPNVVLNSATFTYNYRSDNEVVGGQFNGTPLTYDNTQYAAASPYTLPNPLAVTLTRDNNNLLTFETINRGNPWGLVSNVTLTYNCELAPTAVPADAPWALISLSGLMLVGVAAARRKKRMG